MPVGAAPVRHSVEWLNAAPSRAFVDAMAPLFEGAPRFLSRLADARPFLDEADLFARAVAITQAMPEADQVELIDAHPRIGAAPASVSAASFVEQGYDHPHAENRHEAAPNRPAAVQAQLDQVNEAYEARFGFRCVVFVAGRPRADIVPVMQARLGADRGAELQAALADVVAIAWDRWKKAW